MAVCGPGVTALADGSWNKCPGLCSQDHVQCSVHTRCCDSDSWWKESAHSLTNAASDMVPVRSRDAQVVSLAPTLREGSTSIKDEVSLPAEGLDETPPICRVFAFTVGQRGTEPAPPTQPPFWGPRPGESKRKSPQAALMGVETSLLFAQAASAPGKTQRFCCPALQSSICPFESH